MQGAIQVLGFFSQDGNKWRSQNLSYKFLDHKIIDAINKNVSTDIRVFWSSAVPDMTYEVFAGTLSLTQSINFGPQFNIQLGPSPQQPNLHQYCRTDKNSQVYVSVCYCKKIKLGGWKCK